MLYIAIDISVQNSGSGESGPPPIPVFSNTNWEDLVVDNWEDVTTDTWN